jgi:hypothetical protein
MTDEEFDKRIAEELPADVRMESLLPTLEEQIKSLVDDGRTSLSLFFASLESLSIIPPGEMLELRTQFGSETVCHDSVELALLCGI